jgi:hypothetical protein
MSNQRQRLLSQEEGCVLRSLFKPKRSIPEPCEDGSRAHFSGSVAQMWRGGRLWLFRLDDELGTGLQEPRGQCARLLFHPAPLGAPSRFLHSLRLRACWE